MNGFADLVIDKVLAHKDSSGYTHFHDNRITCQAVRDEQAVIVLPAGHTRTANANPKELKTPQQEITALSKQKWLWMSECSMDSLDALFHEKSVFVHMGGSWGFPRRKVLG